ncbi:MAG TPA: 2-hydroxyacid dehydrogenase [Candidatus Acidoferrales bacterium]|nr:2-hydroxyacid dehydrogenase [Candidatus Acidoferrales bacterium]
MKVLVLSPLPEGVIRSLFAANLTKYKIEANFVTINEYNLDALKRELADTDIVVGDYTFKIPITAEMCDVMNKVKLIQQPSTGFDHIDIRACANKGIPVANIGGANAISVAEHTLTLALVLLKHITYAHQKLLEGIWTQAELLNVATELSGKTWGLVGLGRIGREVAERAKSLGAKIIYFDVKRLPEDEENKLNYSFRQLQKLLSEADVVSIHVPLTPETEHMIGEKELRMMRSTSIFINPSRGELTDEAALAKALREGWIGGAGVDVFSKEPPDQTNPLISAAHEGLNIVLTPHLAGATSDARMRIIQVTVENVLRVMLGQKPQNVVNL